MSWRRAGRMACALHSSSALPPSRSRRAASSASSASLPRAMRLSFRCSSAGVSNNCASATSASRRFVHADSSRRAVCRVFVATLSFICVTFPAVEPYSVDCRHGTRSRKRIEGIAAARSPSHFRSMNSSGCPGRLAAQAALPGVLVAVPAGRRRSPECAARRSCGGRSGRDPFASSAFSSASFFRSTLRSEFIARRFQQVPNLLDVPSVVELRHCRSLRVVLSALPRKCSIFLR